MKRNKSIKLFEESVKLIPGGVNSPVRAFKNTGITPVFIKRGMGCKIYDVDGNAYIDYIGSWGPLILGHCAPEINEAIIKAVSNGTSFGAPTEQELTMAKLVTEAYPSVDMVRMVNSGTEATMSVLRLARAYTDRKKIIKFNGCYHGHSDSLLVKAGSGALTFGVPNSPGVTSENSAATLTAEFNDLASVEKLFYLPENKGQIAAVIIEPVAGNMGVVAAEKAFIQGLRELTAKEGALLIFDEVMSGFRVAYGGAAQLLGVKPDLACFGKIIGGGLPVGAYGGRREIMAMISPSGPVYQAGTLSGNPAAMGAGIAALTTLRDTPSIYSKLEILGARLENGMIDAANNLGIPLQVNRVGSMLTAFFTDKTVIGFETACCSDTGRYNKFFTGLLEEGIYIAPSQYEAMFISRSHTEADIDFTLGKMKKVLESVTA